MKTMIVALLLVCLSSAISADDWPPVTVESGLVPANAFRSGTDQDGNPLYLCWNLHSKDDKNAYNHALDFGSYDPVKREAYIVESSGGIGMAPLTITKGRIGVFTGFGLWVRVDHGLPTTMRGKPFNDLVENIDGILDAGSHFILTPDGHYIALASLDSGQVPLHAIGKSDGTVLSLAGTLPRPRDYPGDEPRIYSEFKAEGLYLLESVPAPVVLEELK